MRTARTYDPWEQDFMRTLARALLREDWAGWSVACLLLADAYGERGMGRDEFWTRRMAERPPSFEANPVETPGGPTRVSFVMSWPWGGTLWLAGATDTDQGGFCLDKWERIVPLEMGERAP